MSYFIGCSVVGAARTCTETSHAITKLHFHVKAKTNNRTETLSVREMDKSVK